MRETARSRSKIAGRRLSRRMLALGLGCLVGCSSPQAVRVETTPAHPGLPPGLAVRPPTPVDRESASPIRLASATETSVDPFDGKPQLSEQELIQQVRLRNPTIGQMTAAVRAANARYPQVVAWDDPNFGARVGPASINSSDVNFAYWLDVSQAIPFPGKLGLRGESAMREAAAAGADLDDTVLQLAEAARNAFVDYYQSVRAIEINDEGIKLLREFRDNASTRYRNGQGEKQDVLQADVAIARQQETGSMLERVHRVTRARINTLLNREADHALPPPPQELGSLTESRSAKELRDLAVEQRPDVVAVRARTAAEESRVALALREYYPDFEVMAGYNAFMQQRDLQPMVGFRLNVPVQLARRDAAVAQAQARVAQRRAELSRLVSAIGLEIQEAYERLQETERSLKLYEETALPAARENVRLARVSYANGKVPFINLIEAQRNLVELRDRQLNLIAESRRRRAALDRAIGETTSPVKAIVPQVLPTTKLSPPQSNES